MTDPNLATTLRLFPAPDYRRYEGPVHVCLELEDLSNYKHVDPNLIIWKIEEVIRAEVHGGSVSVYAFVKKNTLPVDRAREYQDSGIPILEIHEEDRDTGMNIMLTDALFYAMNNSGPVRVLFLSNNIEEHTNFSMVRTCLQELGCIVASAPPDTIMNFQSRDCSCFEEIKDGVDLHSLLSSPTRDFLLRNDGQKVKIDSLKGKMIGLYFSASWCQLCHSFTPQLVEVYNELSPKVGFEVVFVSGDEDEESFRDCFSYMPWLSVPFTDSETRDRLDEVFKTREIPNLIMIDDQGKVLGIENIVSVIRNYVGVIRNYGADAYPFTRERMKDIIEEEDRARREQTLTSVLVSPSRGFVISQHGTKVPVSELEGKTIGLLFSVASCKRCTEFSSELVEVYNKLKENGEDFEIVLISLENDEESFMKDFEDKPWLALPFNDHKSSSKLAQHFMISTPPPPTLLILGPDGKTRHSNVAQAIEDYGILAYPFTPEKFEQLEEIEAPTLESLLVSGDLNYVLGKDGAEVLVSDLVGKNILLYFSGHWCAPCRTFTPKLVEVYKQLKERDEAFELIFISSDRNLEEFSEYYSEMPWLALPYGDPRKPTLARAFELGGIPMLVATGPTGKAITKTASDLVEEHGADAYPFTKERLKEIEAKFNEMAKEWPKKVKHALHDEHELQLTRVQVYTCDKCGEVGKIWSYHCDECDFDLHDKCALNEETKDTVDVSVEAGGLKRKLPSKWL